MGMTHTFWENLSAKSYHLQNQKYWYLCNYENNQKYDMKARSLFLLFIGLSIVCCAQEPGKTRFYCDLMYTTFKPVGTVDGKAFCVLISYNTNPYNFHSNVFDDLDGNYILHPEGGGLFYSIASAANYMSKQNWKLMQTYSSHDGLVEHWVMYKDANTEKEALSNIFVGKDNKGEPLYKVVTEGFKKN